MLFLRDCINRQRLSLQKELDKACAENTELQAEELALMESTSCLYKKYCTLFSCEFCLCKQLDVLSEKEKEMFTRELVFIEDLESKQKVSGGIRLSDIAPGLTANLFKTCLICSSPQS